MARCTAGCTIYTSCISYKYRYKNSAVPRSQQESHPNSPEQVSSSISGPGPPPAPSIDIMPRDSQYPKDQESMFDYHDRTNGLIMSRGRKRPQQNA